MLGIVIPVFILWHTVVYEIFFAFIAVTAIFEILHCTGLHKSWFILIPSLAIGAILPFIASDHSMLSQSSSLTFSGRYLYIMMLLLFYYLTVSMFSKGKYSIQDTAISFVMIFYVLFGIIALVAIRDLSTADGHPLGIFLVLLVFIASWLTDTGAYFIGVLFGKHKLIPEISPKKTVEGAIGGIVVAVIACLAYAFIINRVTHAEHAPKVLFIIIAAVAMSIISQIGDLIASYIKRKYEIKDYGKLIPGHGGVVDRLDSVVAASVVLYILCTSGNFAGMIM